MGFLRRSNKKESEQEDVELNPVPATVPPSKNKSNKADGSGAGVGFFRKKNKGPTPATRDEFSMASGSTWTTKATELGSTSGRDAAGNLVMPSAAGGTKWESRDAFPPTRDQDAELGGRPARTKLKSALRLGGNRGDDTNISVVYNRHGDKATEVMNLVMKDSLPVPQRPTDVIVQIEASTISLPDCIIRRGKFHHNVPLPTTPGFDAVGRIIQIGEEVSEQTSFKVGDRVAALVLSGGNARYVNVPSSSLVKVPDGVESTYAACIISTYMTAFQALDIARRSMDKEVSLKGKKILVTGGNGPVGRAVIQLARRFHADEVYATAYGRDHGELETMGAIALPFPCKDWLPRVEGAMDIVIDGVCVDNYASPHAALNATGQLVCIGMTSLLYSSKAGAQGCSEVGMPSAALWASLKANLFMSRTSTYELWDSFAREPDLFKSDASYLFELAEAQAIKPAISKLIPLSEVADAHERLETGNVPPGGQIVCIPWKKFVYVTSKKHKTDTESVVTPKY